MRRRRRRRRRRRIILASGLIVVGGRKMRKSDVEQVEEHTGKSAEDLTDEELDQATNELGIEGEEMTDEEWEYVEEQDVQEKDEPISTDAPAGEPDYLNELERLAHLHDQGVITDEEFTMKKKQLLGL
jgi:hypothetical protein